MYIYDNYMSWGYMFHNPGAEYKLQANTSVQVITHINAGVYSKSLWTSFCLSLRYIFMLSPTMWGLSTRWQKQVIDIKYIQGYIIN